MLKLSLDAALNSINERSSDIMSASREKGRLHVRIHLNAQMGLPMDVRKMYALGLVDGVAEWLVGIFGPAATYESLMRIADKCIDPSTKGDTTNGKPQPKGK